MIPSQNANVPSDAKTDLNQFCQRYCRRPVSKQDIMYVVNRFGDQYQSIVKLNCFAGQEYAGHLCSSSKEAEKSAAHQALVAYEPMIQQLFSEEGSTTSKGRKKAASTSQRSAQQPEHQGALTGQLREVQPADPLKIQSRTQQGRHADGLQPEDGENPAITPKTKLNSLCMKLAGRFLQKGETIYETMKVTGGGYQATVRLCALPGEWANRLWAGEVCNTKQKAEQSAADIALRQLENDTELEQLAEQAKAKQDADEGKGSGKTRKWNAEGYCWNSYWGGWVWQGTTGEGRERVSEDVREGEVIDWKETHGWIKSLAEIDHPMIAMRQGKIYVNKKDLAEGVSGLTAGGKVQFILYEDPAGLGGEDVRPL